MGVSGLTTLLEEAARERPDVAALGTLAQLSRSCGLPRKSKPRLLVDMSAALHTQAALQDKKSLVLGSCDWVAAWCTKQHKQLLRAGVTPEYFFDTSDTSAIKHETILARLQQRIDQTLAPVMSHLDSSISSDFPQDIGSIMPHLAKDQATHTLHRLGATIHKYPGEADEWMIHLFDPTTDLAIVSADSDFFCAGVRYIPLSELKVGSKCEATLYSLDSVCELLDLPPDLAILHELSALCGNDYTKPLLQANPQLERSLGVDIKSGHRMGAVARARAVLDIVRDRRQGNSTCLPFVEMLAQSTEPEAVALMDSLEKLRCTDVRGMLMGEEDSAVFGRLEKLVQEHVLPPTVFSIRYRGHMSGSHLFESLGVRHIAPAYKIMLNLQAALALLVGRTEPVTIPVRTSARDIETHTMEPLAVLPSFLTPAPCLSQKRVKLVKRWSALFDLVVGSTDSEVRKEMPQPPELSLPLLAVIYQAVQSAKAGARLPEAAVLALALSATLPPPPGNPQVFMLLSTSVSLLSHFQAVYSKIVQIVTLLRLSIPMAHEPLDKIKGSLFQHLFVAFYLHDCGSKKSLLACVADGDDTSLMDMLAPLYDGEPPVLADFGLDTPVCAKLFRACRSSVLPASVLSKWGDLAARMSPGATLKPIPAFAEQREAILAAAEKRLAKQQEAAAASSAKSAASQATPAPASAAAPAAPAAPAARELQAALPIMAFESQIVDRIHRNQVTVIQADTGAGKSTRVPQMICQHSHQCNIVVTQPRRMAATSLAKRVAKEMNTAIGERVGYRIGKDARVGSDTVITFVTSGWLLHRLVSQPAYMQSITHLVLDEIHERSVDSDLLYVIVKRLMRQLAIGARAPKLILMSATFNTAEFAQYFAPVGQPAPEAIYVGAHRYPVDIYFAADMLDAPVLKKAAVRLPCPVIDWTKSCEQLLKSRAVHNEHAAMIQWLVMALATVHRSDKSAAVILVFLPGLAEIEKVYEALERAELSLASGKKGQPFLELFMLHSQLDGTDQERVFTDPTPGTTRVVLSTNIAESSVTLPNVKYVIDLGLAKQVEYDSYLKCDCLRCVSVSKASAKQRSGRCGRVCPGTVFRLYTEQDFARFDNYDTPELLRVSLASVLLKIKHSADECTQQAIERGMDPAEAMQESPYSDPRKLLSECIDPPAMNTIKTALDELLWLGAVATDDDFLEALREDEDDMQEDEFYDYEGCYCGYCRTCTDKATARAIDLTLKASHATQLGGILAQMPMGLRHGKAVYLAAALGSRYIVPALVAATALTENTPFILPHPKSSAFTSLTVTTVRGRMAMDAGNLCDIMALIRLVKLQSKTGTLAGRDALFKYQNEHGIHHKRAYALCRSIAELARRLQPLLPHCSAQLEDLHYILKQQRDFDESSEHVENASDLEVLIDRVFDLSDTTAAVVQCLFLKPLWENLCTIRPSVGSLARLRRAPPEFTRTVSMKMPYGLALAFEHDVRLATGTLDCDSTVEGDNEADDPHDLASELMRLLLTGDDRVSSSGPSAAATASHVPRLPALRDLIAEMESLTLELPDALQKALDKERAAAAAAREESLKAHGTKLSQREKRALQAQQKLAAQAAVSQEAIAQRLETIVTVHMTFLPHYEALAEGEEPDGFPISLGELALNRCFVFRGKDLYTGAPMVKMLVDNVNYDSLVIHRPFTPKQYELDPPQHPGAKSNTKVTRTQYSGLVFADSTSLVPQMLTYKVLERSPGSVYYGLSPLLIATGGGKTFRSDLFSVFPFGSPEADLRTSIMLLLASPKTGAEYCISDICDLPLPAHVSEDAYAAISLMREVLECLEGFHLGALEDAPSSCFEDALCELMTTGNFNHTLQVQLDRELEYVAA